MSDRHPFIYNEFDIEAARKAGASSEQSRILALLKNIEGIEWVLELIEGKQP